MKRGKKNIPSVESGTVATHGLSSTEALMVLNEFRQARAAEENVFNDKINEAVADIKRRALWWLTCVCAALTLFGWFADSIIRCVVSEKMVRDSVQEELGAFTHSKMENMVKVSAAELEARIGECSNILESAKHQLHLLKLRSQAIAGSDQAYIELKSLKDTNDIARDLFSDVVAYYDTLVFRSNGHKTLREDFWGFTKVDFPKDELVKRVNSDSGVTKDTLNDLINLVSCYDDGKNYVGLLVEKANVCSNLHYRIAIVDCIHAHFQDSPVTLNMDELNKWWEKTHKPEYERGCNALKIHEENVLK